MRLLIDTQVFLWAALSPERLSARAREALADVDNIPMLSAASCWELAIKAALGKLVEIQDLDEFIDRQATNLQMVMLPVGSEHALRTRRLPFHHRDPFDRLLIAQAQVEQVPIVTSDQAIRAYDVQTVW